MTQGFASLAVLLTLSVYLISALQAKRKGFAEPDAYFLSKASHSKEEYGTAQIAYSLQMATIYPFFLFAFSGWWWLGLWNTLFFAAGIVLFYALLSKFDAGALNLVGQSATLHAFIGVIHDAPFLRLIASSMSIIAFAGLAVFEIVWGANALKVLFGGASEIFYLSIIVLAAYMVLFLWAGGQRATLKTDQYQLLISYIGLHLLTAWAIGEVGVYTEAVDAPVVLFLIVVGGAIAVARRILNIKQDGSTWLQVLNLGAIGSLGYLLYAIIRRPGFFSRDALTLQWEGILEVPDLALMLVTMAALPIFFQFIDMSNWQRLSSIAGGPSGDTTSRAKKGLQHFLVETPLSWLLPIALGMFCAVFMAVPQDGDAWQAFLSLVNSQPGGFGVLVAAAGIAGLVAVFLSTADALLNACGYTFAYDIRPSSRRIMDTLAAAEHKEGDHRPTAEELASVLMAGRIATSVFVLFAAGSFVLADLYSEAAGSTLISVFLAFYTPLVAMAPCVLMPALTGRRANSVFATLSVGLPGLVGVGIGVASLFLAEGFWAWSAAPFCLVSSWLIYLFGWMAGGRPIASGP